jgi:hypothetical protein
VAALLAGWLVDAVLDPFFGSGPRLVVSFFVSTIAFYFTQKWLKDLRDT